MTPLDHHLTAANDDHNRITSLRGLLDDWREERPASDFSWVAAVWIWLFALSGGVWVVSVVLN